MNNWTELSVQYANQRNYLDSLFRVYPISPNIRREIDPNQWAKIENAFNVQDNDTLVKALLKLDLFPIKDSYVAYLKRDPSSIERNPNTIARLAGNLYELGLDQVYEKCTEPKETNRQMGHYFKVMLDEIFGKECFKNDITRIKSNPKNFDRKAYGNQKDMILFYSKNPNKNIWNEIKESLDESEIESKFPKTESDGRRYTTIPLHAPGESKGMTGQAWRGMMPPEGRHWRTSPEEFEKMDAAGLIEWSSTGNPRIKKYADEHKGKKIQDIWSFKDPQYPLYPTQKNQDMIELIIKQSSNEGGYVMDCFAGSGSTLIAAIETGRKFIGMDMSSVSIEIIKERLKGYDYIFEG